MMDRLILSDVAWERVAPLIIGRPNFERTARNYLAVVTLAAIVLWLR